MAYKLLSEKELTALQAASNRGEEDAFNQLFKESKRVAKAANSRLLRLERAGFTESNAYERATYYTDYAYGAERFRVNRRMDVDDLIEQYREMRTFMRKESSTVSGVRASRDRLIDALESYDIHIEEPNRNAFFSFVNSDDVQDAIEFIGEYDIVMDAIANNIDKIGNDFKNLQKQFQAFLKGEIFYDELLERISGESYESLYQRHRDRGINYDTRIERQRRNKKRS